MKICILGGGNVGSASAAILAARGHEVILKTSHPEDYTGTLEYIDRATGEGFSAPVCATDSPECVRGADMIFVTVPSFQVQNAVGEIAPFWDKETPLGVIPGSGGAEFVLKEYLDAGHILFGTDRVPCIARVEVPGKRVIATKKLSVSLAALPAAETGRLAALCGELFGFECRSVASFLSVTFTPSNPILHTARLWALYHSTPEHLFPENVLFYEAWDAASSEALLACDAELEALCGRIAGVDLSGVVPLRVHYESPDRDRLTKKLSSIAAFRGFLSPMVQRPDGKWELDKKSRYFTEDFPYGLLILVAFCELFSTPAPTMKKILCWYQDFAGKEYYKDGRFCGKDLAGLAIPQNFGLHTPEDVVTFYRR